MPIKIRRRCACGCGQITGPGRKWINGHHNRCKSKEAKRKMSLSAIDNANALGHKHTKKSKRKMSSIKMGNTNGRGNKGKKRSKETKLKMTMAKIKDNSNYKYGGAWQDKEYRRDLRKDYCTNIDCKGKYKRLGNHHIDLNKKHCQPKNIMTLCTSCSSILHRRLDSIADKRGANHKDYLTIIRPRRITYIHKETKRRITIGRR